MGDGSRDTTPETNGDRGSGWGGMIQLASAPGKEELRLRMSLVWRYRLQLNAFLKELSIIVTANERKEM